MRRLLLLFLLAATTLSAQNVTQCLISNVYVPCSMAPQPSFAQASVSSKSSGSVASINAAYGSNVTKGNTAIVVFANGNNNNPAAPITDTLTLTWFKAVQVANGSAFETEIWYAPITASGADTVTVTPGGSNASIAMTIYEVQGLVYPTINSSPTGPQAIDQTTSNTGTGGTSPAVSLTPIVPNEYVFAGFGLGTAAQTITVASPYNNDSGQQNPTTPAGLFSFVSASLFKTEMVTTSPSASATSEPWAVAVASFKTLSVPIQGNVQGLGVAGTPAGGVFSVQGVASGTNLPINETQINSVTPLMGNGVSGPGSQRVNVASDNTPFETIPVSTATTTDTTLRCTLVSAASTNATNCKNGSGNVYGFRFVNTTQTVYYLRMYNLTTSPTCSSATGFIETIPIPPGSSATTSGGLVAMEPFGEGYSTGIGFCFTGGSSSTDNTNAATGVFGSILYK